MKMVISVMLLMAASVAMANTEYVQVPTSCYQGAKMKAVQFASQKYSNVRARTPFYAERTQTNTIIVPVFVMSSDLDRPDRINVIVRPMANGDCKIGKAF